MLQTAKIVELINLYERFVILMHERPDGDTIACSLAFADVLQQMGKTVRCVCVDDIPKPFRFLPGIKNIKKNFLSDDYDVMILLDCGDLRRTGFPDEVRRFAKVQKRVIHIDHHQKSDVYKLANVKLFDEEAAATGEILYTLFQKLPVTFTPQIATCLLTSLYYDTGAFKHANTSRQVLQLAAQLLHLGGRLKEITQHVELTKSVAALKLWGVALARVKRNDSLGVVTSIITKSDIESCGANEDDVAGIVNLLNSVPESKAAILLTETENGTIRASLRTEHALVDVADLAELFGGGGLRRASGFTIAGKMILTGEDWHIQVID